MQFISISSTFKQSAVRLLETFIKQKTCYLEKSSLSIMNYVLIIGWWITSSIVSWIDSRLARITSIPSYGGGFRSIAQLMHTLSIVQNDWISHNQFSMFYSSFIFRFFYLSIYLLSKWPFRGPIRTNDHSLSFKRTFSVVQLNKYLRSILIGPQTAFYFA